MALDKELKWQHHAANIAFGAAVLAGAPIALPVCAMRLCWVAHVEKKIIKNDLAVMHELVKECNKHGVDLDNKGLSKMVNAVQNYKVADASYKPRIRDIHTVTTELKHALADKQLVDLRKDFNKMGYIVDSDQTNYQKDNYELLGKLAKHPLLDDRSKMILKRTEIKPTLEEKKQIVEALNTIKLELNISFIRKLDSTQQKNLQEKLAILEDKNLRDLDGAFALPHLIEKMFTPDQAEKAANFAREYLEGLGMKVEIDEGEEVGIDKMNEEKIEQNTANVQKSEITPEITSEMKTKAEKKEEVKNLLNKFQEYEKQKIIDYLWDSKIDLWELNKVIVLDQNQKDQIALLVAHPNLVNDDKDIENAIAFLKVSIDAKKREFDK
ncbi:MAG: hypothetical protein H0V82_07180 [Candidatus Protochlamydia sp.]|nr:hypothetical protein [Candidatus Protochlamydia sp.]